MKHVWLLTAVIVFYGLANGALLNATPQAALALDFESKDIGGIGAGVPIGYAISCLLFWRLSGRLRGKYVLLCGVLGAGAAIALMALGRTVAVCTAAQVTFGLAGGAFWPFASAWLLEFQSEGLSKPRLLRHYNAGWTSGTSAGMFLSGLLCKQGLIRETLWGGACVMAGVFVAACLAKSKGAGRDAADSPLGDARVPAAPRVGLLLLIAAVSVNMAALGTRAMILNNYAELNEQLGFHADRMGLLTALTMVTQLTAFSLGFVYEPWLGLRRLYIFMGAAMVAINLAFAYSSALAVLVPAAVLHGLVLAVAFQTAIFAATSFFPVTRTGTTFHEATVGCAGVAVFAAGYGIEYLKDSGMEPLAALRAPFLCMVALTAVALAVQLVLVSLRNRERVLLPAGTGNRSQAR